MTVEITSTWKPSLQMYGKEDVCGFRFNGSTYSIRRNPVSGKYTYLSKRMRTNRMGTFYQPMVITGKAARIVLDAFRAAHTVSLSGGNPSEKSEGLHSDHRGITQARSSEGGIVEYESHESIQSREPVGSNPASDGADSLKLMRATSDDPAPVVTAATYS